MAIAQGLQFKTRALIASITALSLFGTGLILLQPAAAAGTPLLAIGTDVVAADSLTATYQIVVRNAGTGDASDVWVKMDVPAGTTFESSTPPAHAVDGAAPDAPATCDNAGTREPVGTNCQWFLGSLQPGATDFRTVVLNLLPTATNVTADPKVSGKNPGTLAPLTEQMDPDSTLTRTSVAVAQDTWVGRSEPANTNHGICKVLTTRGDGSATAYLDLAPTAFSGLAGGVDKVWAADLQANVAASDYTTSSPGTLAVHAITSGDWTQGGGDCAQGTAGSGAEVRTGNEPAVRGTATATSPVSTPALISWNVLPDVDGAAERAAFQGWEVRNATGTGSADLHSIDVPATDATLKPRLALVYTSPEAGRCIDVDPETNVAHPSSEAVLTAVVYKMKASPATKATATQPVDACNGTPVAGQLVLWDLKDDDNPDIYVSNQAGTPVPKNSSIVTDAGPNSTKTTTDSLGTTFVGIRLANPQVSAGDGNIVAVCSIPSSSTATACPGGQPPSDPQMQTACGVNPAVDPSCSNKGEDAGEDQVRLQWSATATPAPEQTSAAPQRPPTISSFSPTSGPVGTQVVLEGSNFTGASSVRFNGTAASFTVESDSRIATSVPTGATDGPISVRNPAGTGLSPANFDVTTRPATASPTPTRSASNSASPSASGSPTALSPVDMTLTSSVEQSVAFSELTLSGMLSSDNPLCAQPGTTVEILKRDAGSTTVEHLAYTDTKVGGLFDYKVAPEANTIYSALVGEHDVCESGAATPITVLVAPKITIKSTAKKVEAGRRFWITGSVLPEHQLTAVTIWRKTGPDQWEKLGKDFLDASSRYALPIKYEWKKPLSVFQVRWKATDADHISGKSARLRVERA